MFVLLPLIALLLGIAFRQGDVFYPQHLVFMLHVQAFLFLAVTVFLARALVPWPLLARLIAVSVIAWSLAYTVLAARRVYRRSMA